MVAKKTRIFELDIDTGGFVSRFKTQKKKANLDDMKVLRTLLSNEKAKILFALKSESPQSIYQLAKIIERDVKSVRKDVKILSKYGFIEFTKHKKGNRVSHKPELAVERMEFILKI